MARVTVEDCILQVPNRFELVMYAAQRARDISGGGQIMIDRDRDKNPVVALREIADSSIDLDHLRQEVITGLQKHTETEEPEEDMMEVLAADSNVAGVSFEAIADGAEQEMSTEEAGDIAGDLDGGEQK